MTLAFTSTNEATCRRAIPNTQLRSTVNKYLARVLQSRTLRKVLFITMLPLALGTLQACASTSDQPWHTFSYNAFFDKWVDDIDLLKYHYGDQRASIFTALVAANDFAWRVAI